MEMVKGNGGMRFQRRMVRLTDGTDECDKVGLCLRRLGDIGWVDIIGELG
jgi:hypothetical protein